MSYRNKEKQKAAQRKHYKEHKEIYAERLVEKRRRNKKYIDDIKAKSKCKKCGFKHPAALQFHHRDPSIKDDTVSHGTAHWGLKRLKLEIAKCDILCANCHCIKHWG